MVLGPTQPPIQWVPGVLSLGVKRPGREADHSPPSSAEVKEWVELYFHSPSMPSWRGAQLKHRDNFTFTLLYFTLLLSNMASRRGRSEALTRVLPKKWHFESAPSTGRPCPLEKVVESDRSLELGFSWELTTEHLTRRFRALFIDRKSNRSGRNKPWK
jgi:hypothetical protein